MKPEGSFLHSHETTTGTYPKPDESTHLNHIFKNLFLTQAIFCMLVLIHSITSYFSKRSVLTWALNMEHGWIEL